MNQYICMCCDGKKGAQTLVRLRPHKIYCCVGCMKERGGKENVMQYLNVLMQKFHERRATEKKVMV